jgi:Family of unknown function (DUF6328)
MSDPASSDRARPSRSTRSGTIAPDRSARHDGHVSLQLPSGSGRDETPLERVDRNLEELNGELRVVVTGVQVLFAFLVIVPFDRVPRRRGIRADRLLAMCGCLLLVATRLFGVGAGAVTTLAVAAPFAVLWFAMPIRRRRALGAVRR